MSCSKPLQITKDTLKKSSRINHAIPFELSAMYKSNFHHDYINVPCGWCLNCRVDKMNELSDRCEYEYINYGCGAFVTFTFDDYHIDEYTFIDSKDGKVKATLSKKCLKDFLNRLNKLVHKYNKKYGLTPFCRPDYKYLCVGEYGENGSQFDRPHYHCLFFGLDFAMCERLFWQAWQFQGSIQVGAIRNGGIGYVVSYLDKQVYGFESFLKYDYHGLKKPFQVHSKCLGEGLFKSQVKYISEHDGNYLWHGKQRPCPIYYKNKFRIISDLSQDAINKRYTRKVNNILNLYQVKIHNYLDLEKFELNQAQLTQKLREIKLIQNGKPVRQDWYLEKQSSDIINDKHRLPTLFDKDHLKLIDIHGNHKYKIDNRLLDVKKMTTRDFMKMHTSKNQLYDRIYSSFGAQKTNHIFGVGSDIPF